LTPNTQYEIYGEYKLKDNPLWSLSSQPINFTTFDERGKAAMVFAYWMRTIDNDISVETLVDVMMRYFLVLTFKWDPIRASKEFKLYNEGRQFSKMYTSYRSLCSENMLAADVVKARWEMTLKNSEILQGRRIPLGGCNKVDGYSCSHSYSMNHGIDHLMSFLVSPILIT